MKTSRIILLITAGMLVLLWIAILLMVRRDMQTLISENYFITYSEVSVEKFRNLDFSSNWVVSIKQGKDCRVELEDADKIEPKLSQSKGTLYLESQEKIHVRITAPTLESIRAAGDTRIEMKMFWADSLTVILGDSSSYAGSKNDFEYIRFITPDSDN